MKFVLTKRRVAWILISMFAGYMVWTGCSISRFGHMDRAKPADCAVVLGAAVSGTNPSPVFEERIKHAVSLYQSGLVSKIVFTGGYGRNATHAESSVGADYAIRKGVQASAVLTETHSHTTLENLKEAKALMSANSLQTAIIVSDPLHLKRAAMMAEDLGISAVTSATPTSRYRTIKTQLGFLVREIYFYHHYLVTGK